MQNATQLLSLYTLAWLYILMRQELKPYKPVPKFLVVKAVVFFTFWYISLIPHHYDFIHTYSSFGDNKGKE
jgi:hypothetical protein